jgi:soluble lytic murein transglycosylase
MQLGLLIILLWAHIGLAPHAFAAMGGDAFDLAKQKDWPAAIHAASTPALRNVMTWLYVSDRESGASFDAIRTFLTNHPNWPDRDKLELRAEQALAASNAPAADVLAWFKAHPPYSGTGKLLLAEAKIAQGAPMDAVTLLVKDAWEQGDFGESEETRILATYGRVLQSADHVKRINRLLWEDKPAAAERMLPRVPAGDVAMYRAWMALAKEEKRAAALVAKLSPAHQRHAGILFSRIVACDKRDNESCVIELLLQAPPNVPYPKRWWKFRQRAVREAVFTNQFNLAHRLLKNHGQMGGAEEAEARWLKGWVLLESKGDAESAYLEFYHMFTGVQYAVSKSRAAYWAARAAEKMGDAESARSWYVTATNFPTTFYGQRAAEKLQVDMPLSHTNEPRVSEQEIAQFLSSDIGLAIRACIDADRSDLASIFIRHVVDTSRDSKTAAVVAHAMNKLGERTLSVKASKRAVQHNLLLTHVGYPVITLPDNLAIDPALALAFTRQESEFDVYARSRANAMGLMQLLPSTGKEVAGKLGLSFSESDLFDPATNLTLGSAYAARMIKFFDGSLPMAIAAYNAGPGRVKQWQGQFGMPGNSTDELINWLEKIPFEETRNYVHRVMENYFVYQRVM